jgi:hypothetical protein
MRRIGQVKTDVNAGTDAQPLQPGSGAVRQPAQHAVGVRMAFELDGDMVGVTRRCFIEQQM